MDIYGYRASYMLLRPHRLIRATFLRLKWAWQRVVRGWDDTVLWSVDAYITEQMCDILPAFRKNLFSVPSSLLPIVGSEPNSWTDASDEDMDKAVEEWQHILEQMEEGFKAARTLIDCTYSIEERNNLKEKFGKGMELFTTHFFDLWE